MDSSAARDTDAGTPRGRVALALIALSLAAYWLVAVSGPSVVSHELRGSWLPPYSLGLHPSAWLDVALLWLGTVAGAAGTWLGLRALGRGWVPSPRHLLTAAAVTALAFAVVPPVNSDDVYSYAAYGRLAVLGLSPYTTAPSDVPGDPVTDAVTPPWRDTPSVYGPVATAEQYLVMKVADRSVRGGVLALGALGALAFLVTAAILDRYAADAAARSRAALCWALNPLLLFQLVGGAHLDTLGVLAVVVALGIAARAAGRSGWPAVAGAGAVVAAAIAVKLTGGIAAIGLAWSLRGRPRQLGALVLGALLVVVPGYLLAGGPTALRQARRASRFVSSASWWRPITSGLERAVGNSPARQVTSTLALLAFAAMSALLWHALPRQLTPEPRSRATPSAVPHLAALLLAPALAWLLTATYTLPWYAAWSWPLLALVVASRWDDILLAWTAVLTVAYIPGRDVPLPRGLSGVTHALRSGLGPATLAVLLVAAVLLARTAVRSADPAA